MAYASLEIERPFLQTTILRVTFLGYDSNQGVCMKADSAEIPVESPIS
jgi:hypothetical protein